MDTLQTARRLKESGFSEPQAETLSAVFQEVQESHLQTLATKSDLAALRGELKSDIAALRSELKGEIAELRSDLTALRTEIRGDIAVLRADLKTGLAELHSSLSQRITQNEGEIRLLKWMFGFTLASLLAVFWMLIRLAGGVA